MGVDTTKCDHSELGYKSAAIKKIKPSVALEGKAAAYVDAVFDIVKLDFASQPSAVDKVRRAAVDSSVRRDDGAVDAEDARRRYNERLFAAAK